MFFYSITSLDKLIMKPIFSSKQRKLSHLTSIFGHQYLLKDILKQIDFYHNACVRANGGISEALNTLQTQYQFLNSIDRDFSTPLLLALKNKRANTVKILMDHPKTDLR